MIHKEVKRALRFREVKIRNLYVLVSSHLLLFLLFVQTALK
jgi:hypothetical protein